MREPPSGPWPDPVKAWFADAVECVRALGEGPAPRKAKLPHILNKQNKTWIRPGVYCQVFAAASAHWRAYWQGLLALPTSAAPKLVRSAWIQVASEFKFLIGANLNNRSLSGPRLAGPPNFNFEMSNATNLLRSPRDIKILLNGAAPLRPHESKAAWVQHPME